MNAIYTENEIDVGALIGQFYHRGNPLKKGLAAYFLQVGDVGIKWFRDVNMAHWTFVRQKLASIHSLGPKIGQRFYSWVDQRKVFGYYTQVADCILSHELTACRITLKESNKIVRDVTNKLAGIGILDGDLSQINIGRVSGNWVAIDFSDGNCATEKKRNKFELTPELLMV